MVRSENTEVFPYRNVGLNVLFTQAYMFDPATSTLIIPAMRNMESPRSFSVFQITDRNQILFRGDLKKWPNSARTDKSRHLTIENYVYGIGDSEIVVAPIATPSKDTKRVFLAEPIQYYIPPTAEVEMSFSTKNTAIVGIEEFDKMTNLYLKLIRKRTI